MKMRKKDPNILNADIFNPENTSYNIIISDDEILPRQFTVRVIKKLSRELNINFNIIEVEDGLETIYIVYYFLKTGQKSL
jgi:hypothetical protein